MTVMTERMPLVLLTSTTNAFEGHVIQARLQSEGVDAELRGAVGGGPYPFTVGTMGEVQVYVPSDQLDDAQLVMLATEVDSSVGSESSPTPMTRTDVWVIAAVLAVIVIVTVARLAQGG